MEAFDVNRDGRLIASSDDQNRMHLYDASTNRLLRTYPPVGPSGDERMFLSGVQPRQQAARRDPEWPGLHRSRCACWTRTPCSRRRSSTSPAASRYGGCDVGFSADGRYLAATVHTVAWPRRAWTERRPGLRGGLGPPLPVHAPHPGAYRNRILQGMALSPDGQILYTDWPLTAYDVATGKRIWRREDVTSPYPLDVNVEGTLLAVADTGERTRIRTCSW